MAKSRTERQKTVTRNLIAFREELGLSQSKMAAAIGVPPNTWSSWEQGLRIPSTEMMFRIAEVLDRTVDEMAADKPERSQLPFPPAVAIIKLDDLVDPEIIKQLAAYVRDLNRKHRQLRARQRRSVDLATFESETAAMEERAQVKSEQSDKASRDAKKR